MNKIPFKAVAVDMDGTFLNQDSDYNHELFKKVFTKMQNKNIHFVIASGNELTKTQHQLEPFAEKCDYVCENGALVATGKQIIFKHYLPAAVVKRAVSFIEQEYPDAKIIISSLKQAYILKDNNEQFKQMVYHSYAHVKEVDTFTAYEHVLKITLNVSEAQVKEIAQAFAKKYGQKIKGISGGGPWMDLINPDDDKSRGLKILMDYLHIPINQLMIFGDGGNDIQMLKMTPLSFAMANGTPEAKNAAKHLAPSNREDGVLKTLEQYLF